MSVIFIDLGRKIDGKRRFGFWEEGMMTFGYRESWTSWDDFEQDHKTRVTRNHSIESFKALCPPWTFGQPTPIPDNGPGFLRVSGDRLEELGGEAEFSDGLRNMADHVEDLASELFKAKAEIARLKQLHEPRQNFIAGERIPPGTAVYVGDDGLVRPSQGRETLDIARGFQTPLVNFPANFVTLGDVPAEPSPPMEPHGPGDFEPRWPEGAIGSLGIIAPPEPIDLGLVARHRFTPEYQDVMGGWEAPDMVVDRIYMGGRLSLTLATGAMQEFALSQAPLPGDRFSSDFDHYVFMTTDGRRHVYQIEKGTGHP
jgi:hypothetical protein